MVERNGTTGLSPLLISFSFHFPRTNGVLVRISPSSIFSEALDLVEWIFTRFGNFPTISHAWTLNSSCPLRITQRTVTCSTKCEVRRNFNGGGVRGPVADYNFSSSRAVNFANGEDVSLWCCSVRPGTAYQDFESWDTPHWLAECLLRTVCIKVKCLTTKSKSLV